MIRILQFETGYASEVLNWVSSPEELKFWTARDDFPLENVDVFEQWHADPDIEPYLLAIDDLPVGYGELWCETEEPWAEMARLLISPDQRDHGIGKILISELEKIVRSKGYPEVWVRVIPENLRALKCYESAGFEHISDKESEVLN